MTATPAARLATSGSPGFGPGKATTSRTPGTDRVALGSKDASPPEKYGQRSTTATSAPGSDESIP